MKKTNGKIIAFLVCVAFVTSCGSFDLPIHSHEISGHFYINRANYDPNKGQLYSGSGEIVLYKPNIVSKVYDVGTTYLVDLPIEGEESYPLYVAEDAAFDVNTMGKNKYIRVLAQGTTDDPNVVYRVDTVIKYRQGYEDLNIVLQPRHRHIHFTPNPAHIGDRITDVSTICVRNSDYHDKIPCGSSKLCMYFKEKDTGVVADSLTFYYEYYEGVYSRMESVNHYKYKGAVIPSTLKENTAYEICVDTVFVPTGDRGYYDSLDFWVLPKKK